MYHQRFRRLGIEPLEPRHLLGGAPPFNLVATPVSQSEINLTWSLGDATDTSIIIDRMNGTSGTFQVLTTLPGGEDIFTDTSCWASSTYSYRVQTDGPTGLSAYSNVQQATTFAVAAGALATVTTLQAVANSPTSATVSFTDPNTSDSYRSYILERSSDGVSYQVVASLEQATSWTDTGLTPGATYYYRVLGCSWDAPTSDYSAPASITMPARAAVEPSAIQAIDLSATAVALTWTNNDPSDPQFEIDRAVYNPWDPMTWAKVALTAPGATSFTDTGLTAQSAYVYRIRAVNSFADSDYGAPASDVQQAIFGAGVGVCTASLGTGTPKTYDIGPGYAYPDISDLNWAALGPGDTVNIHYKPGGYHDLFLISTRGTATAPITINGVPDPVTGALPVIDGFEAVLAPQFEDHDPSDVDGAGCVVVGCRPGFAVGYKPGYLVIQNLQFQDCYEGNSVNTFTDYDGSTKTYGPVGAGIYLERCDHVTIQDCVVTNNGEGIFGAGQSGFDRLMTNITLDSNYIYGNGDVGSYLEHNTYLEGIDTVYEYNYYGPLRPGAGGCGLKDRSVGTIICYNYIDGGAHQLDLVESQNQQDLAMALPEYHTTLVYGNFLVAPPGDSSSIVLYGGDLGLTPYYRKGTLYFYSNTLVARSDQSSAYYVVAMQLASPGESLDARNNIFAAIPNTTGATPAFLYLLSTAGMAYYGVNWVTPGYWLGGWESTSVAAGLGNLLVGASINPGFVNLAGGDYHLAAGSPCIDAAGAVLPGTTDEDPDDQEFIFPHGGQARPVVGSAPDLGAFEYGTPVSQPGITVTPQLGLVTTQAGGTATFSMVLNSQPTDSVTIGLSSSNSAEGTVSPASLTFTPDDWSTPQTVTVTGADDMLADGNVGYTIDAAPAVTNDPAYAGLVAPDVSLTNLNMTCVWIGGTDDNWSTAANWSGDPAPQPQDRLVFQTTTPISLINNLPAGQTYRAIDITGPVTLSGNSITLDANGGVAIQNSSGTSLIAMDATLVSDAAVLVSGGSLSMTGTIDASGYALTWDQESAQASSLTGQLTGQGSLIKLGDGSLSLIAANSLSGGTTVLAGTLTVSGPNSQSSAGSLMVGAGGIFEFAPSQSGQPTAEDAVNTALSGMGSPVAPTAAPALAVAVPLGVKTDISSDRGLPLEIGGFHTNLNRQRATDLPPLPTFQGGVSAVSALDQPVRPAIHFASKVAGTLRVPSAETKPAADGLDAAISDPAIVSWADGQWDDRRRKTKEAILSSSAVDEVLVGI